MNRILEGIIMVSLMVSLMILLALTMLQVCNSLYDEKKQFDTYKNFCKDRPNFCYCDSISCEYKTSWSSTNGLSEDTKELCEIAKQLNDKKMLFKIGCN